MSFKKSIFFQKAKRILGVLIMMYPYTTITIDLK